MVFAGAGRAYDRTMANHALDELQKNSEDTRNALERMVREYSEAAMKKMNLPTRKEMEELQRRVAHLENELLRKGQA